VAAPKLKDASAKPDTLESLISDYGQVSLEYKAADTKRKLLGDKIKKMVGVKLLDRLITELEPYKLHIDSWILEVETNGRDSKLGLDLYKSLLKEGLTADKLRAYRSMDPKDAVIAYGFDDVISGYNVNFQIQDKSKTNELAALSFIRQSKLEGFIITKEVPDEEKIMAAIEAGVIDPIVFQVTCIEPVKIPALYVTAPKVKESNKEA
jgi:hypothetical protein